MSAKALPPYLLFWYLSLSLHTDKATRVVHLSGGSADCLYLSSFGSMFLLPFLGIFDARDLRQ